MSPLEQLGGDEALVAIVETLYRRLVTDPMVGFFFEGRSLPHLVAMQTAFTRRLLGDTSTTYTGKSIPEAHAGLPILPGHFDRRHQLLRQVLEEKRVPDEVRELWLRLDQGLRPAVLRAGAFARENAK